MVVGFGSGFVVGEPGEGGKDGKEGERDEVGWIGG